MLLGIPAESRVGREAEARRRIADDGRLKKQAAILLSPVPHWLLAVLHLTICCMLSINKQPLQLLSILCIWLPLLFSLSTSSATIVRQSLALLYSQVLGLYGMHLEWCLLCLLLRCCILAQYFYELHFEDERTVRTDVRTRPSLSIRQV